MRVQHRNDARPTSRSAARLTWVMPSSKVREGTALMLDTLLTLAADPAAWAALLTLIALEVVLGIDNLIFISILSNKLPRAPA